MSGDFTPNDGAVAASADIAGKEGSCVLVRLVAAVDWRETGRLANCIGLDPNDPALTIVDGLRCMKPTFLATIDTAGDGEVGVGIFAPKLEAERCWNDSPETTLWLSIKGSA
jgi:hypothetical protein